MRQRELIFIESRDKTWYDDTETAELLLRCSHIGSPMFRNMMSRQYMEEIHEEKENMDS